MDIVRAAEQIAADATTPRQFWIGATVAFRWGASGSAIVSNPMVGWGIGRTEAEAREHMHLYCREHGYPKSEGWDLYTTCRMIPIAELRTMLAQVDLDG